MEPKVHKLTTSETRHWAVRVGIGLAAFVAAYLSASLAIDRGSMLAYLLTLVLLVVGTREFALSVRDTWRRKRA